MINPIKNQRLIKALKDRTVAHMDGDQFQSFECAVCSYIYEQKKKKREDPVKQQTATTMHYKCPTKPKYPAMSQIPKNDADWRSIMSVGRCKAILLDKLFKLNKNYTKEEFMQILKKDVELYKC